MATGLTTTAIGASTTARGEDSSAIGAGATSYAYNSLALGVNSTASRDNSVSVGSTGEGGFTRQIVNVAAGTQDTDAVNLAQLNAAILAAGGLGSGVDYQPQIDALTASDASQNNQISALNARYAVQEGRINALDAAVQSASGRMLILAGGLDALRRDMRRGVAGAAAVAGVIPPSAPGRTTVNMNIAAYDGEAATSIAFAHRLAVSRPVIVHLGGSFSAGKPIVRGGFSAEF